MANLCISLEELATTSRRAPAAAAAAAAVSQQSAAAAAGGGGGGSSSTPPMMMSSSSWEGLVRALAHCALEAMREVDKVQANAARALGALAATLTRLAIAPRITGGEGGADVTSGGGAAAAAATTAAADAVDAAGSAALQRMARTERLQGWRELQVCTAPSPPPTPPRPPPRAPQRAQQLHSARASLSLSLSLPPPPEGCCPAPSPVRWITQGSCCIVWRGCQDEILQALLGGASSGSPKVSHNGVLLRRRARHVPATAPQSDSRLAQVAWNSCYALRGAFVG
jgi:hypothetical protein